MPGESAVRAIARTRKAMAPVLIVHVRNGAEAEEAIFGGASILSVDVEAAEEIAARAGGRAAIMLRLDADFGFEAARAIAVADKLAVVVHGKVAIPLEEASSRLDAMAQRPERIAVIFADDGLEEAPAPAVLAKAGFADVLIDLADESAGGLPARLGLPKLRRLIDAMRAEGLPVLLGGALEAPDVPRLRVLSPEALLFDTGLRRNGALTSDAVRDIASLISVEPAGIAGSTDRIFLRDHVVEMEIGAYGHERGRRQRVRFSVEVDVPCAGACAGMGGVYSYDLIADAIALLTDGAHVDFVETLAEDLSAMILADPRVVSVRIRVEKLDLGSGSFGIEILRNR